MRISILTDTSGGDPDREDHTTFVLFDLYETLVSFEPEPILAAREWMADRLGVSAAALDAAERRTLRDRMCGRFGETLEDELSSVISAAGVVPDSSLVADYQASQLGGWMEGAIIPADVMPCLDRLRAARVRLGLISNCSRMTAPLLERWPFCDRFDYVILSCDVGSVKPDEVILRHAVGMIGDQPQSGLFVDDKEEFVAAALGLGMRACQIVRTGGRPSNGHVVISNLDQLVLPG